jgi:ABC-type multidrug transport system fused ATPase/permease subunit
MTRMLTAFARMKGATYVFDFLPPAGTAAPEVVAAGPPFEFREEIVADKVSFTYEGGEGFALRDVSFTIRRGEKVGFVGPSGSGKTTVMNLVLRFIREQAGELRVDGRRLQPGEDRRWQRLLGYVEQDPYLMDGTFAENIAFGDAAAEIDRARVEGALKAASLHTLVASLPHGIDTLVGEFGGTLSGGQRQRIAIARALYRNAEILVLDEATSALDADTEREVMETILGLQAGHAKTVLVIAHHGAMLGICDRVYQLEAGRIVGEIVGPGAPATGAVRGNGG